MSAVVRRKICCCAEGEMGEDAKIAASLAKAQVQKNKFWQIFFTNPYDAESSCAL